MDGHVAHRCNRRRASFSYRAPEILREGPHALGTNVEDVLFRHSRRRVHLLQIVGNIAGNVTTIDPQGKRII